MALVTSLAAEPAEKRQENAGKRRAKRVAAEAAVRQKEQEMAMQQVQRNSIFLAVPFRLGSEDLVDCIVVAASELGFNVIRTDESPASGRTVLENIRALIKKCTIIIGDVTDSNANVMWELGYAQALKKPVLIITQDPGMVPIDLRDSRVLIYQPNSSRSNLISRFKDAIEATRRISKFLGQIQAPQIVRRDKAFFSYSHVDHEYLERMLIHLRPVERSGAINIWSDTKIQPGDRWREEIRKAVDSARVAILLISADFLASEFIVTNELPPLLQAAEKDGARIIPVIIKPSRFLKDENLSRFQAINDPKQPMIRMIEAEREELYANLSEIVEAELSFNEKSN